MNEVVLRESAIETLHGHPIKCYDSGEKYADRYSVYYLDEKRPEDRYTPLVSMSAHPSHPQGFGQHGEGLPGKHNGKRVPFASLPKDCQRMVLRDLGVTDEPA